MNRLREGVVALFGPPRHEPSPIEGARLHHPASLFNWYETAPRHYVGGHYEVTFIEPYKWEIRHRGRHVEFDESLEWSFRIAENHHREMLRSRDLRVFGGVALASAIGLLALLALPRGHGLWVLAAGALWVLFTGAVVQFLFTLARIGRLLGGARYATPFGRSTYLALRLSQPLEGSPDEPPTMSGHERS